MKFLSEAEFLRLAGEELFLKGLSPNARRFLDEIKGNRVLLTVVKEKKDDPKLVELKMSLQMLAESGSIVSLEIKEI